MTQLGRCTKATHDVFSSIILQSWIQVNFWFQSWFPDDLLNIFWMRCIEKSNRTIESTGNIYIYTSIIQYYIYIILMMMIIIIIIWGFSGSPWSTQLFKAQINTADLRNTNWQKVDQLALYKCSRGIEPRATWNNANWNGGQSRTNYIWIVKWCPNHLVRLSAH